MTTFERTIEIAATPARVWEVMSDTERWHEWTPSVTRIHRLGAGPLRVGSRLLIRQPRFPPALWTATDVQPGREFTWVSVAPGLRVVARHAVTAHDVGTSATLSLTYHGLLGDWLGRVTRETCDRYLDFEASGLEARSETPSYRR